MAQPRTPKKDNKEKPVKQIAMGYVSYLSPKSSCSVGGRPQFDIHLQNDEKSMMKAKGFGEENYRRLATFSKDKSPVKMQLFKTTQYPTPTCGYNSQIAKANKAEVPFDWNEKLDLKGSSSSDKVSTVATIAEILSDTNFQKFYTVVGKLHKGDNAEKRNQNNRIKEDNVIFQKDETIKITLWNSLIDQVETGNCYSFSHVRLNDFDGLHLSTSFWSKITLCDADENILIPEEFAITDELDSIIVKSIGKVGIPDVFNKCGTCKEKVMESNIRKKAYTCTKCEGSHFNSTLVKDCFTIDVVVNSESESVKLTLTKELALKVYEIDDPQEVADELEALIGYTIAYNVKSNVMTSIKRSDEEKKKDEDDDSEMI